MFGCLHSYAGWDPTIMSVSRFDWADYRTIPSN